MAFMNTYPTHLNEEERKCFDEIRELARKIPRAHSIIMEDEGTKYFLLEIDTDKLDKEYDVLFDKFNDGTKPLMLDYVYDYQNTSGESFNI